jgi:NAD(P)-dependent dehydrogenase (short-subunit alcohol dehydrogenase family)
VRRAKSRRSWIAAASAAAALVAWAAAALRGRERLAGKVALVTGGSRGFGLLLARELGRRGARVAICARDDAELERARAHLGAEGVEALALPCDIGDAGAVRRLVEEVAARLGPIDVLVNNAGIIQVGPAETMGLDDYRHAMQTMFWGAVHASEAVLPSMRARRRGTIVDVTSIGAEIAVPHLGPYSAAKFAHRGYSEVLNAEARKYGIRVVTVLPGLMRTGSVGHALVKGWRELEASLFAIAGSAPLITRSAERNARRVVRGVERRESFLVLGVQAKAARLAHALLPRTTLALLALVNRLLPVPADASSRQDAVPGEPFRRGPARSLVTALGDRAGARLNEEPAH